MEWLENWEPPNLNNKLLEMSLENINGKKSCPTDVTPYDGIYKLTSKKEHTLPIYISEQQWKLHFFDGQNWKFSVTVFLHSCADTVNCDRLLLNYFYSYLCIRLTEHSAAARLQVG